MHQITRDVRYIKYFDKYIEELTENIKGNLCD